MPHGDKEPYDLTEKASRRSDERATSLARQLESDDANEENAPGNAVSPDVDSAGANCVTTSLSED